MRGVVDAADFAGLFAHVLVVHYVFCPLDAAGGSGLGGVGGRVRGVLRG